LINDAGLIVYNLDFGQFDLTGQLLFVGGGGGPPASIIEYPEAFLNDYDINNNNQIAFDLGTGVTSSAVYVWQGGILKTIALGDQNVINSGGGVSINDGGTVAFGASMTSSGLGEILESSGGAPIVIASSAGPNTRFSTPSINDSGSVAFWAQKNAGGQVIIDDVNGTFQTIADDTGPYQSFGPYFNQKQYGPAINNSGTVAFGNERVKRTHPGAK